MNFFEFVLYSSDKKFIWDKVVRSSKNGNFLHLRDFMDYHAHCFDERSVLVLKKGRPIAVFPCNRLEDDIVSHSGLTYGGLIYGTDVHAAEVLDIFNQLAEHYRGEGCVRIMYKAIPHIFHSYPAEEDLYALYRLGATLYRRDISSALPIATRLKLTDSRKCTIRKSAKFGVEIREGDFFEAYHALLTQVLSKFGSQPVHTLSDLCLLKNRFPNSIRLFGGFLNEELLAGTIIFDFGQVVHTQYLASSDAGREMGALDFVLAQLIENTFAQHSYFSFGISTEQSGRYLNEGLIFQKEGFGARGVVHDFYQFVISRN